MCNNQDLTTPQQWGKHERNTYQYIVTINVKNKVDMLTGYDCVEVGELIQVTINIACTERDAYRSHLALVDRIQIDLALETAPKVDWHCLVNIS